MLWFVVLLSLLWLRYGVSVVCAYCVGLLFISFNFIVLLCVVLLLRVVVCYLRFVCGVVLCILLIWLLFSVVFLFCFLACWFIYLFRICLLRCLSGFCVAGPVCLLWLVILGCALWWCFMFISLLLIWFGLWCGLFVFAYLQFGFMCYFINSVV